MNLSICGVLPSLIHEHNEMQVTVTVFLYGNLNTAVSSGSVHLQMAKGINATKFTTLKM
jgi:hypothetical protein